MLDVRLVEDHLARPFVYSACSRYELPFDPDSGEKTLWWAGFDMGSIRSISGWCPAEGGAIVLVGPFGDGSRFEEAWLEESLYAMQRIGVPFIVVPASPSLYIQRQSAQLERYGSLRTPKFSKAS